MDSVDADVASAANIDPADPLDPTLSNVFPSDPLDPTLSNVSDIEIDIDPADPLDPTLLNVFPSDSGPREHPEFARACLWMSTMFVCVCVFECVCVRAYLPLGQVKDTR